MTANDLVEIRIFLTALADSHFVPARIPPGLRRLAAFVVRRSGESDDALQDFVCDLLERDGQSGSAAELVKLEDSALVAALRRRLLQVSTENRPGWKQVKALREQVRAVLAEPVLEVPLGLPVTLVEGDRLCREHVRDAVAWVISQVDAPPRTAAAIAERLLDLYSSSTLSGGFDLQPPAQAVVEDDAIAAVDAVTVAGRVREALDPALVHALWLRARGATLSAIAHDQGIAVSTAHGRVAEALVNFAALVEREGAGTDAVQPVLALLGAEAA